MKRTLIFLTAVVVLVAGGWAINDRARFDRNAWLEDFEQLKTATEQSYANLRWSRTAKNVDLVALNETTLAQLQQATSNSAARRALANFINGFNDNHFHIEHGPPPAIAGLLQFFERAGDRVTLDLDLGAADACSALGFNHTAHELALEGVAKLEDAVFAAGRLRTPAGRQFGVIRIPKFQQFEYGAVCEGAWQQFSDTRTGTCDESCQDDFSVFAKQAIAQALADDANALIQRGAEAIVIDLTGNGGGTEWAEFASAALSARPLQPAPAAFVRGRHWLEHFAEDLAIAEKELAALRDSTRVAQLQATRAELLALRDSAARVCNLRSLWMDRAAQPDCWNDVRLTSGVHPPETRGYARPFTGRVYIMTDARTASASEQFAALLVDNGVAETIGEKTMGAGCGYTNGGNPTTLKNSGLVIWMPDCARLRADGSNEFEGITPDHSVSWGEDNRSKTRALAGVLDRLPKP